MSQAVNLLQFLSENDEFIEEIAQKKFSSALLSFGKIHDDAFNKLVERFNSKNNLLHGSSKSLSLPRLKMLIALVAQKKGFEVKSSLGHGLYVDDTPSRFQSKFKNLLVTGFWLLGSLIEHSLSEDVRLNCGNPFGFKKGDLGFWWAGVISLDWLKYENCRSQHSKIYPRCSDFYNDCCVSRYYLYNRDSALSSMNRIPQQFLSEEDQENFTLTIDRIDLRSRKFWSVKFASNIDRFTGMRSNSVKQMRETSRTAKLQWLTFHKKKYTHNIF